MHECMKTYGRDSDEVKVNADLPSCSVLESIGSRKDYNQEDDPQDKMISAISAWKVWDLRTTILLGTPHYLMTIIYADI